ncbi:MAG: hypothetical protein J6Y57_04445 [Lachnospiraceae bacterium]|nr:hypothetical protein [Lachnospiraceae bacterium]
MSKGRKQTEKVTKYRKPININLGLVIFSVLFIYIVVIIVSYFRSEHITPYEVSVGSLAVNNTYEGIVLREERVVESPYSGYVNYYARESEKVNNGAMIFTVDSTGKLSDLIKDSEGSGTLSDEDMAEIRNDISDFGSSFDPHHFKTTYEFKYSIEGTALKLANYKMLSNIESLFSASYSDSIDFGYAPCAGILVYSTDGYEGLKPEDMTEDLMKHEEYEKKQFHSNDLIAEGDPAYKLVTSENWYIMIEIDEAKAQELAEEDYMNVRFLKNNDTSWAKVSVLRQNGTIYALLEFNNSMVTFATDRILEIELLSNESTGLKIPNSSIVERAFYLIPEAYMTEGGNSDVGGFMRETYMEDGTISTEFVEATIYNIMDGECYVDETVFHAGDNIIMPETGERYPISKQASLIGVYNINKGYADFKQITILAQNDEYAIVKSNTEYGLSVYDHIVLKGDTVTENDFIYQ